MRPALVSVKSAVLALFSGHPLLAQTELEPSGYGMYSGWYLNRLTRVFIQRRSEHLPLSFHHM